MPSATVPISTTIREPIGPNPSTAPGSCKVNTDGSTRQEPFTLASEVISPALQVQLDTFKGLLEQQGYELSNPAENTDDTTLLYGNPTTRCLLNPCNVLPLT
jgi:hypothetical protein